VWNTPIKPAATRSKTGGHASQPEHPSRFPIPGQENPALPTAAPPTFTAVGNQTILSGGQAPRLPPSRLSSFPSCTWERHFPPNPRLGTSYPLSPQRGERVRGRGGGSNLFASNEFLPTVPPVLAIPVSWCFTLFMRPTVLCPASIISAAEISRTPLGTPAPEHANTPLEHDTCAPEPGTPARP